MALEELIRFSNIIGKLKVLKRSGWISQVGITEPESVADHSFRCAVLAMCIGDLTNVDTEKLIKMLLWLSCKLQHLNTVLYYNFTLNFCSLYGGGGCR